MEHGERCGDKGRREKLSSRSRREEWRDREEGLGERRLPTWHHHDQCDYSWKWISPVETGTLFSVLDLCDRVTVTLSVYKVQTDETFNLIPNIRFPDLISCIQFPRQY